MTKESILTFVLTMPGEKREHGEREFLVLPLLFMISSLLKIKEEMDNFLFATWCVYIQQVDPKIDGL